MKSQKYTKYSKYSLQQLLDYARKLDDEAENLEARLQSSKQIDQEVYKELWRRECYIVKVPN